MTVDAAHDCPPCPGCKEPLGTPIRDVRGVWLVERWDGDEDATLYCPACGHGWKGSDADLRKAQDAWVAYEKECAG